MSKGSIIGIRVLGETLLSYHAAANDELQVRAGDWVVVDGPDGGVPALVVLTEDQLVLCDLQSVASCVLRPATAYDSPAAASEDRIEGSLERGTQQGFGGSGTSPNKDSADTGTSHEDTLYRILKACYPTLGAIVSTPMGEAMVVAVEIRKSIVTTRSRLEPDSRSWHSDEISGWLAVDKDILPTPLGT